MKTYNDMELTIGINCGDTSTDSANWSKYTQSMRREAIANTEMKIFKGSAVNAFTKLISTPLNATEYISGDILSLPDNLYQIIYLYHETTTGVKTPLSEKTLVWDKLQDDINFNKAIDPYFYHYGERKYQLRHSISSPNVFYIIARKFPQTYDPSFNYGNTYTELTGCEEHIVNGATGELLLTTDQPEKASSYIALFNNYLKTLIGENT